MPDPPLQERQSDVSIVRHVEAWHGPVPDAETMERYTALYPDAPEIIFRMAQKEQEIRSEGQRSAFTNERSRLLWSGAQSLGLLGVTLFALWLDNLPVALSCGVAGPLVAAVRIIQQFVAKKWAETDAEEV